jgi:hypothetical protein
MISQGKTVFHCPGLTTLWRQVGAKWFSTLDLKNSHWQVVLHPDNKEKIAFSTVQGLWYFNHALWPLQQSIDV